MVLKSKDSKYHAKVILLAPKMRPFDFSFVKQTRLSYFYLLNCLFFLIKDRLQKVFSIPFQFKGAFLDIKKVFNILLVIIF